MQSGGVTLSSVSNTSTFSGSLSMTASMMTSRSPIAPRSEENSNRPKASSRSFGVIWPFIDRLLQRVRNAVLGESDRLLLDLDHDCVASASDTDLRDACAHRACADDTYSLDLAHQCPSETSSERAKARSEPTTDRHHTKRLLDVCNEAKGKCFSALVGLSH
jgi:hypothetical protein